MASKGLNPDPPTNADVKVPANTSLIDGLQALGRYAGFLIGVVTTLLAFFKARDLLGAANYVQNNIPDIITALVGIGGLLSAGYGILKTFKRGGQLETAAADPRNKGVQFKQ
jgi:hypothetical protein